MISYDEQQAINSCLIPRLTDHLNEICPEFGFKRCGKAFVSHMHIDGTRDKKNANTTYIYADTLCIYESSDKENKKSLITLYQEKNSCGYRTAVNILCDLCGIDRIFNDSFRKRGRSNPPRPKTNAVRPQPKANEYDYLTKDESIDLCSMEPNPFTLAFIDLFRDTEYERTAVEVLKRFRVCTYVDDKSVIWTCFPYIDKEGRICDIKIMRYDGLKRVREGYSVKYFARGVLHKEKYETAPCLFGMQFLTNEKPVVIVESEKTALLCSVKYPDVVCIASGGCSNLNEDKAKLLKGCDVKIFFDEDVTAEDRRSKIELLQKYCNSVNLPTPEEEYRIRNCGEKSDIGDVIIQDILLEKRPKPTAITNKKQVLDAISKGNPCLQMMMERFDLQIG